MTYLRYAYRAPWLVVQVLIGVTLAFLLLNPLAARCWDTGRARNWLVPWWSRGVLRVFGIERHVNGEVKDDSVLFAANHLSWLDIVVLHSARSMAFVAKGEIRRWPLVGWMAGQSGTIFHQRGSPRSLTEVSEKMAAVLIHGDAVGLFPEAGVGDGKHLRPFHGRLFQCAFEAGVCVQPVALRYVETDGSVNTSTPFRRGESFVSSLLRIMRQKRTVAQLYFCRPIAIEDLRRREVAQLARERIEEALSQDCLDQTA